MIYAFKNVVTLTKMTLVLNKLKKIKNLKDSKKLIHDAEDAIIKYGIE